MTETRPVWSRKDISEEDARWFRDHSVVRIDHRWEMTGADTSRSWLELFIEKSGKRVLGKKVDRLPQCVSFTPNWRELLDLDSWVADEVDKLKEWDKRHAKDIAELKRLQAKLYGTNPDA